LALKQKRDENKKKEDKRKELQDFIARFSSNASKARQATSRKKMLEKLTIDDIKPSSRKFPFVMFKPGRECGRTILEIENLTVSNESCSIKNLNMILRNGDKIAFLGDHHSRTLLFQVLAGEVQPESGTFKWGETITLSYFPKENGSFFKNDLNLVDWMRQFTEERDENFVRGFLGRMLFSGDEVYKKVKVLSGGEKVRCMLSRMMLSNANALILDEPTNHLDLESITAVNDALISFSEIVLFSSHDHKLVQTIANRVIEFTPNGIIDRAMSFDDYMENEDVKSIRDSSYGEHETFML
ncbi:MAG: ABC-F family ATP-binding cassette domain-containing protein, partial [Spirochaetota bacterium]